MPRSIPLDRHLVIYSSISEAGCWEWQGHKTKRGYGRLHVHGRMQLVHRVSYELGMGKIPLGYHLDHLCMNPLCMNPAHLEPVTNAENARRAAAARTSCGNGHAYTSESHYLKLNARVCRVCIVERRRGEGKWACL